MADKISAKRRVINWLLQILGVIIFILGIFIFPGSVFWAYFVAIWGYDNPEHPIGSILNNLWCLAPYVLMAISIPIAIMVISIGIAITNKGENRKQKD